MNPSVGWLLTLEAFDASIGWSLIRDDGRGYLTEAGIIDAADQTIRPAAAAIFPSVDAGPGPSGIAGLWAGHLTDPDVEQDLANILGGALLPRMLRETLLAEPPGTTTHTVTIATRGWLSQIPWELLTLSCDGPRLLEHAMVGAGLSPAVVATRTRTAHLVDTARFAYAILDPGPVTGPTGSIYPSGYPEPLVRELEESGDDYTAHDEGVTPDELAYRLHRRPSRMLYVGHIRPGRPGTPAAAALVLRAGRARAPHLLTARQWLASPERWPSPARVALIGCASDDTVSFEQSGLVVAAVNAGAHLVTATRWPLPTDNPVGRDLSPTQPVHHEGLTELALAVHSAHRRPHPVAALRTWQLAKLARWRESGQPQHSPLLWASPITYSAPPCDDPR